MSGSGSEQTTDSVHNGTDSVRSKLMSVLEDIDQLGVFIDIDNAETLTLSESKQSILERLSMIDELYDQVKLGVHEFPSDVQSAYDAYHTRAGELLALIESKLCDSTEREVTIHPLVATAAKSTRSSGSYMSERAREARVNADLMAAELAFREREFRLERELFENKNNLERELIKNKLALEQTKAKVLAEAASVGASSRASSRAASVRDIHPKETARPSTESSSSKSEICELIHSLSESLAASRLPPPEPAVFKGDPLLFPDWEAGFNALIDQRGCPERERIHYLKRYLGGSALKAVSGYFLHASPDAYKRARELLAKRYGNHFIIAEAFRSELSSWAKIGPRDGAALRSFSDFLVNCQAAASTVTQLKILDDCRENRLMLEKLPEWLVNRWKRVVAQGMKNTGEYPKFEEFCRFIEDEADVACNPATNLKFNSEAKHSKLSERSSGTFMSAEVSEMTSVFKCLYCNKDGHAASNCFVLSGKSQGEKEDFVRSNNLCFGCLKPGHVSKMCEDRSKCKKCSRRHPTCLHEEKTVRQRGEESSKSAANEGGEQAAVCSKTDAGARGLTSMIVPVWIRSRSDRSRGSLVYALLDSMSDTTFVCSETASTLRAPYMKAGLKLSTMTSRAEVLHCRRYSDLEIRGYESEDWLSLPPAFSRDYIPANRSHIPDPKKLHGWKHLRKVVGQLPALQDCPIGVLIGYNCPQALAPRESIVGTATEPYAVRTSLGWSVVGPSGQLHTDHGDAIGVSHTIISKPVCLGKASAERVTNFRVVSQVKELMALFERDFRDSDTGQDVSQDDRTFLKVLQREIVQEGTHYSMPLPFRDRPSLPNNRDMAYHRCKMLMKKFSKDKQYCEDYEKFMTEMILSGDAELVPREELENPGRWYIPHFGVYHPKKPGKLRVVFDASAKYKQHSLNEHLLQGPDLLNGLFGVLLRFRRGKIAFKGDIQKMFHQFRVHATDRDYLRFLWTKDGALVEYRMTVHLFGARSSPGCATFGLRHIASQHCDEGDSSSVTARDFIKDDFYVDDGLSSVETPEEAIQLIKSARSICEKGGVRLHKFVSNSRAVMEGIPRSERAECMQDLDFTHDVLPIDRTLGVEWCVESDTFRFRVTVKAQPHTRRGLLSTVASIYDPLGFLAPFVLLGKLILQEMCREGTQWDSPLSDILQVRWNKWLTDLTKLDCIKIQRCFTPTHFGEVMSRELHHFSDASSYGYGQCSYLKLTDVAGNVHCSLVAGKARVLPLRPITIPRAELQGAVLSAEMASILRRELKLAGLEEYFWTDSAVVLGYVTNDARRFAIYVANRVQKVRDLCQGAGWYHVDSDDNPADCASRGVGPVELLATAWFSGPKFLWNNDMSSVPIKVHELRKDDPEVRVVHTTVANSTLLPIFERIARFSSWDRAVSAFTVLRRYVRLRKGVLTARDVNERCLTENFLIRQVQEHHYGEELKRLHQGLPVKTQSPLSSLCPRLEESGLIRVGGRLEKARSLSHGERHPIIIPPRCHLTELLIRNKHEQCAHQGRSMTLMTLRQSGFWIIGGTSAVGSVIRGCVACKRMRGKPQQQVMASLPEERVNEAAPFTLVGADCFGPFTVREKRSDLKRYGVVFTCLTSRAVHVEVLEDMTTDAFLNALRCLVAVRGHVRRIITDRGSNFIGAHNELMKALEEMKDTPLRNWLKERKVEFVTNFPYASHMGGVWERQIRTIRSVLTGLLIKHTRLDTSSLRTLLLEVSAIVNSRPLCTEDVADPSSVAITPNLLLTMKSDYVIPPGDFVPTDDYARKRWRRVQLIAEEFWTNWRKKYLQNLQSRPKWTKPQDEVKVGDVVLMVEETPRCLWKMGRVTETVKSHDDRVRKVKMLIGGSSPTEVERPIHRVVSLCRPGVHCQ